MNLYLIHLSQSHYNLYLNSIFTLTCVSATESRVGDTDITIRRGVNVLVLGTLSQVNIFYVPSRFGLTDINTSIFSTLFLLSPRITRLCYCSSTMTKDHFL